MNITQARDEILTTFRDAWVASSTSASLPVLYPDTADDTPPDSGAWARVTVQHGTRGQTTLSNENGVRRYRATGFVTAQIFTPRGKGLTLNDQLAKIVLDAFDGVTTAGGVAFYRARTREIGPDSQWFHTNVLVDFDYDEVK